MNLMIYGLFFLFSYQLHEQRGEFAVFSEERRTSHSDHILSVDGNNIEMILLSQIV